MARLAQGDAEADRDAGRRRRGDREPARDPAPPQERDDVRPLRRRRVEDRRAQPRGRSGRDRAERQSGRRLVELGELLAALLALAEVPLVGLGLVRVERVERVCGGQVVGVHDVSVPGSPSSSRMRDKPPEHPAFDGTERLAEPLGELRLGEASVVRELERLPLRVGKVAQRRLHALALQPQERILLRALDGRLGGQVERVGAPPLLAPDGVDRPPVHEREDPRARLAALGHEAGGAFARR